MVEAIPLEPSIADEWLGSWIRDDPFSNEAVLHLQSLVPAAAV
jgi:hypothetical protein